MGVIVTLAISLSLGAGPTPDGLTARKVRCDIQVIHATSGQNFVDPQLKPISRYLKNSFGARYQSFRQLGRSSLSLAKKQKGRHMLPNDTKLLLTYLGASDSLLRIVMEVGGLKTTVKVHDGGLFFQAGRKYKGGMLIVAIRARGTR